MSRWRDRLVLFAFVACVACGRSKAQQALQITIHQPSIGLTVGDTTTVQAVVTVSAQEAPVTVEWSSDNDAVAQVSRSGRVTARSAGVTGITARVGTAFASTRVSVSPAISKSEQHAATVATVANVSSPARTMPPPARSASPPAALAPAVAAPTSAPRVRATVTSNGRRAPQSPHFSHINLFYTDFGSRYMSPADREATIAFLAPRLDGVMSGPRQWWKTANPTIQHFPYVLQFTMMIPGQKGVKDDMNNSYLVDMQRWYGSHPQYELENAFLHRGGHDASHRISLKIWDSQRYVMNPGDEGHRAYQSDRIARIAQGEDGVFLDEFGGPMSGATKPSDEYSTPAAYLTAEAALIGQVHDAIKPRFLLINIAEYWTPADSAIVVAGGGAHLERTNFPFQDRLRERWTEIDNLLKVNVYTEFVTLWSYTDWVTGKKQFPSFNNGMYGSLVERGQIMQLASYYMAVPADPRMLSFDQQNLWNVRPDTVWAAAVEADVGHPREARHIIATGSDSAGQKYAVYARDFDHAYVLIRPAMDWRKQVYGDTTSIVIPLPSPMRPLHRDGSFGQAVTSVTLRNVEAAILFK